MTLNIISADERLAATSGSNIAIFGPAGIGKTTLARGLDPETTLFVDLEAGTQALGKWRGGVVNVRKEAQTLNIHPWDFCRALACIAAGYDPSASVKPEHESFFYSRAMFEQYCGVLGGPDVLARYRTLFWDSITEAGRYSFSWAQMQPDAVSEKTGKYDGRGAYGRHGREMIKWLKTIQHATRHSTVVVGILNVFTDDFGRVSYEPQIDGSKTGNELPGIFDQVLTLANFSINPQTGGPVLDFKEGKHRAFVCHQNNGFGVPAKDRSGCLDNLEPPDLAHVMAKIAAGQRQDDTLVTTMPVPQTA